MWEKLNQSILRDNEEGFLDEESEDLCSLSATQRMYAFGACLLAGLICMFLGFASGLLLFIVGELQPIFLYWKQMEFPQIGLIIFFFKLFVVKSMIVFAKPIKFAILFTFGNLLAVGSTAFLFGPAQQMRMMFDTVRIYATAIYLGCVVLALICALLIHSKILTLIAMICEVCALIWYSLSYIPFARRMVSELMIRLCDTEL